MLVLENELSNGTHSTEDLAALRQKDDFLSEKGYGIVGRHQLDYFFMKGAKTNRSMYGF